MAMTPGDVRNVAFNTVLRGYSEQQVDEFLDLVEAELERLTSENTQLQTENAQLRQQVAQLTAPDRPQPQAGHVGSGPPDTASQAQRARNGYGGSIADAMRPSK